MPALKTKNPIIEKLRKSGAEKQFEAHKADETKFGGGGDLPAGITGVAMLVEAKLDEHKDGNHKGKPYLYLAGVVVEPKMFNNIPIEGDRTNKTIGLYDKGGKSSKKQDDMIAEALNEMRKLGINTTDLKLDDWDAALSTLKSQSPYFKFRTWQGAPTADFPNPGVNHQWGGKLENYLPGAASSVNDQSGSNGDGGGAGATEEAAGFDWAELGRKADDEDDTNAQETITNTAKAAGLNPNSYPSWTDAAQAIAEHEGSAGGSAGASEGTGTELTVWKPQVDEVYMYQPKDAKKPFECKVTAVFETTVNLEALVGGKIYRKVVWSPDDKNELQGA